MHGSFYVGVCKNPFAPPSPVLTPLAYKVLAWVPYFVALGVFPYLSYASLKGVQLTSRIKLLFVPPKHHPDVHYVRKVGISVSLHCTVEPLNNGHVGTSYSVHYSEVSSIWRCRNVLAL